MESLIIHEQPNLHSPVLVVSYTGWPDAQEGASEAVRCLIRQFSAKKCAEIDPEEFYVFTRFRPFNYVNEQGQRVIRWPSNEFFYATGEKLSQDMLFLVGTEPNMRWRTYSNVVLSLAEQCGAKMVLFLGSLLDTVPHTREPRVTGGANRPELQKALESLDIFGSGYQGPTGAATALMEACSKRDLPLATIWGHAPNYIQVAPNPKVSVALLKRLSRLLRLQVNMAELEAAARAFDVEVAKALSEERDVAAYVKRLEEQHDQALEALHQKEELPSSEALLQGLEEFLRQRKKSD